MSKIRVQPKDTHWPPEGVRDIRPKEPMNAGALTVRPMADKLKQLVTP